MMRKAMVSMACRVREALCGTAKASSSASLFVCSRIEPMPRWSYGPRQLLTGMPGRHGRHPCMHMPGRAPGSCFKLGSDAVAMRQYQSLQFPARNTYGYMRPFSAETALRLLVAANTAVFCGWRIDPHFMQRHFLVSLQHVREGRIHTILTSCFSHKDGLHLLANMVTLYFMWNKYLFPSGRLVLFLYLAGGVVGNLAFLAEQYAKVQGKPRWAREYAYRASMPALGASGSVNACVIFSILAQPSATVLIYGILPVPAALLGVLWIYSDISGAVGGGHHGGQPIGYTAHLGGAAMGALTWYAYSRGRLRL